MLNFDEKEDTSWLPKEIKDALYSALVNPSSFKKHMKDVGRIANIYSNQINESGVKVVCKAPWLSSLKAFLKATYFLSEDSVFIGLISFLELFVGFVNQVQNEIKEAKVIVSEYNDDIYEKWKCRKNLPYLKDIALSSQQRKTVYCISSGVVECVFHICEYHGEKYQTLLQQVIPLTIRLAPIEVDYVVKKMLNCIGKELNIVYKVGNRIISPNGNSFVRNMFDKIAEGSNYSEQPYNIEVCIGDQETSHKNVISNQFTVTTLDQYSKCLRLPEQAALETYFEIYPLHAFKDEEKELTNPIEVSSLTAEVIKYTDSDNIIRKKNTIIKLIDRVYAVISPIYKGIKFVFNIYPVSKEYSNDLRLLIGVNNKEKLNSVNSQLALEPIYIFFEIKDDHLKNIFNNDVSKSFKVYRCLRDFNVWVACGVDSSSQSIYACIHKNLILWNNKTCVQVELKSLCEIKLREQVKIFQHWIDRDYFDDHFDKDYTNLPSDELREFSRGGKPYYLPLGWKRLGLKVKGWHNNDMDNWAIAYHASDTNNLPSLLRDHIVSYKTLLSSCKGKRIEILPDHIPDTKETANHVRHIFLSPSVNYVTHPCYMKSSQVTNKYQHMVFMVRVNPKAIWEKPETLHYYSTIDPNYHNRKLEWLIKNPADCVLYGILVRETTVNTGDIWKIKRQLAEKNDSKHIIRDIFELEKYVSHKIALISIGYENCGKSSILSLLSNNKNIKIHTNNQSRTTETSIFSSSEKKTYLFIDTPALSDSSNKKIFSDIYDIFAKVGIDSFIILWCIDKYREHGLLDTCVQFIKKLSGRNNLKDYVLIVSKTHDTGTLEMLKCLLENDEIPLILDIDTQKENVKTTIWNEIIYGKIEPATLKYQYCKICGLVYVDRLFSQIACKRRTIQENFSYKPFFSFFYETTYCSMCNKDSKACCGVHEICSRCKKLWGCCDEDCEQNKNHVLDKFQHKTTSSIIISP